VPGSIDGCRRHARRAMLTGMNPKTSARVLVGLSILYGLLIGLLAVFDVAVVPAAIIGAFVLGALWVLRGVLLTRHSGGH
jgi:hypothetical protein